MRARVPAAFLVALGTVLLLVGCAATTGHPAREPASSGPASSTVRSLPRSVPTKLRIPSIGARSSLVRLGLNSDRTVQVPPVSRPKQAGWYEYGPTPGQVGPAVVLGHVDGDHHKGIFWDLKLMKPGQEVDIARKDGRTARFTVRAVDRVPKHAFPTKTVYGDTSKPELRLITCGGSFDHAAHSYRDNVIVYADLK